ncbi:MAG: hypothetical protein FRX49_11866 [Trebouxia sp. A1-2]|nr:MAG: hypothetical protein FRX49_11866 [Trebouxia sp. A1-2]
MSAPNLAPLPEATHSFTHASVAAVVLVPKQDTWREAGRQPGPPMCMKLNGRGFWSPGPLEAFSILNWIPAASAALP